MYKSILILYIFTILFSTVKSQTILPDPSTEVCPNTEYAFEVRLLNGCNNITISGAAQNVSPQITQYPYGIVPASNQTIFYFKAKFQDYNDKQAFFVQWNDISANTSKAKYFYFSKIKSLLTPNASNNIYPTSGAITSARCQITTHNISFQNSHYGNLADLPASNSYGTLTDYEYLLPAGWKLNGVTSNGSTWLLPSTSNNVTVTSDLTTGDGGYVKIRASNIACGVGLKESAVLYQVPITRPAPTLTITGDQAICTSSFKTYTLNGVPLGASVTWSLSSTLNATIPVPSNGTTVNVTKVGIYGAVILSATVTDCFTTYPPVNFEIKLGAPTVLSQTPYWSQNGVTNYLQGCNQIIQSCTTPAVNKKVISIDPNIVSAKYNFCATGYITDVTATSFSWSKVAGVGTHIAWNGFGSNFNVEINANFQNEWITLRCTSVNTCGSAYRDYKFYVNPINNVNCPYCPGCRMAAPVKIKETSTISIFPNPSNGQFNVTLNSADKNIFIKEVRVKNKIGALVYQQKFNTNQKTQPINISNKPFDMYIVEVFDGNVWQSQKLSLQK